MTETPRPIRRILVVGHGLRAWLPAAYLSVRFPAPHYSITVVSDNSTSQAAENAQDDRILARPCVRHLHQVLQITERELVTTAQARPALGVKVHTASKASVFLPFGSYGTDRAGAEFYQHWRRAYGEGKAVELDAYNLAAQLDKADAFILRAPQGLPAFDYGYTFSRAGYMSLLKQYALKNGANEGGTISGVTATSDRHITAIKTDTGEITCDMVINTSASNGGGVLSDYSAFGWSANCLSVANGVSIPGIEVMILQKAMERFIALLPDQGFNRCETGEYNRLTNEEQARVKDMETLLFGGNKSDALQRKIKVFSARGRVPLEDHEAFTKPEWIAAMTGAGIKPSSYDRLVDRVDLETASEWLGNLERAIMQTVQHAVRRQG